MQKANRKNKQNKKNKSGSLLVEAVFAVFIVGVTMVTFVDVLGALYRTEFTKKDQIIATNLAQEGIELVRSARDNNWKTCVDGSAPVGAPPSCATGYKAAFDAPSFPAIGNYIKDYTSTFTVCGTVAQCKVNKLKKYTATVPGFYQHSGIGAVTTSKFSRVIVISGSGDTRLVTSTVYWIPKAAAAEKNITISDTLYAWANPD